MNLKEQAEGLGVEEWEVCDSPKKTTITHHWVPAPVKGGSRELTCIYCDRTLQEARGNA